MARWYGLGISHCSGCHEAFSAASVFDAHRAGSPDKRVCLDPRTATDPKGRPLFSPRPGRYGVTYVGFTDEPWTGPDD